MIQILSIPIHLLLYPNKGKIATQSLDCNDKVTVSEKYQLIYWYLCGAINMPHNQVGLNKKD